jgi:hypothetical protein
LVTCEFLPTSRGYVFDLASDGDGFIERLFFPGLHLFWKEHGDRSTLGNWAHILGYSKIEREMLGRWSPQGTDEYLRTAKTTVLDVQKEVALRIRTGAGLRQLGEEDTLAAFTEFLSARNVEQALTTKQVHRLSAAMPRSTVPPLAESSGGEDSPVGEGPLPLFDWYQEPPPEADPLGSGSDVEVESLIEPGAFVVSLTAGEMGRTLHRVGRCWRLPGVHFKHFKTLEAESTLAGNNHAEYSRICKDCYPPKGEVPSQRLSDDEGSLTVSSGSSSSSAQSDDD